MGVEGPIAASDTLYAHLSVLVDQDRHLRHAPLCYPHGGADGLFHSLSRLQPNGTQQRSPLLLVRPRETGNNGDADAQLCTSRDEALRDVIAPGDSTEDVQEDHPHLGIGEDDPHGVEHLLWPR